MTASPDKSSGRTQKVLKDISQGGFMAQPDSLSYEFGRFRLKTAERILLREGELVPLTPKVFDILITLVENCGQVVSKDDLMKRVWPSTYVEEGNLTQNISLLRKALGETPGGVQFIETVPRRGYRFVADIRETANGSASPVVETVSSEPETVSQPDNAVVAPVVSIPVSNTTSACSKRTPAFALMAGVVVMAIVGLVYFTTAG